MSGWKQKASTGGGNYEKAPPGNHPAVLIGMIDMGTQEQEYQGESKESHRVYWVWEIPGEKREDGSSHVIALDLTFSLNEKAKMRKWIESRMGRQIADGEEYDIAEELGKPCLLNVVQKDKYPKVEGMSALPKGMPAPVATHKPFAWQLDTYLTTGKIELPPWVPYLFGEPLSDHIRRSREAIETPNIPDGGSSKPAPAASKPAAPSAPSSPSRPKPPSPPAAPAKKYWLDLGNGETNQSPLDAQAAGELLFSKGLNPDVALACVDGENDDWKPASTFGIKVAF